MRTLLAICTTVLLVNLSAAAADKPDADSNNYEWQLPNDSSKLAFKDERPIYFVNRSQNYTEWMTLPKFWNEVTEKVVDPSTQRVVERRAVKIRVPLGLTQSPPVPLSNPMTVARWELGKRLYFDPILSSDRTVSCASCHDPKRGFTDQAPVSTGIRGQKGGMSAPTVYNSGYNLLQFWDGRAATLEDQAQGPVQNPIEMFSSRDAPREMPTIHPWQFAVRRLRADARYVKQFKDVFGTAPTRDGVAKAIATYERTVLTGNSIHDRAEVAMRKRIEDEESGKLVFKAKDYETVLKAAFTAKDTNALAALGLNPAKDNARIPELATRLNNGRELFFNKARCSSCHVGDNFTDNQFHNLGVGIKGSNVPDEAPGRFGALSTGHKNPEMIGAFKTPTLRQILSTAPYMHDGSEATLEKVVDFYDRGGNANEFLDTKMRDFEAEKAYTLSLQGGPPFKGTGKVFGPNRKPIIPLQLKLTAEEKKDLILFLRALQGDPADPILMQN